MKNVLLLGAGFVAKPIVRYLLDQPDIQLTNADIIVAKAEKLIDNHSRGTAKQLDIENREALKDLVIASDIVVSLLPWTLHLKVALLCLEYKKHFLTTSYVKSEMQALDQKAKQKGLLFLNELGVDPGIDHMAAMKVIHGVKNNGGKIRSFYSYCGGLPALENNNNPFGYKFSWSPSGVMLAATNEGKYKKDGQLIVVPGEKLFEHYWLVDIPEAGTFETYVNRDALPYWDLYDLQSAQTMYRGTLRNVGYCESWTHFKKIGLLDQYKKFDLRKNSPRDVIAKLINSNGKNLINDLVQFLNIPEYSVTIKKLEWLGLLLDEKLPLEKISAFEMFSRILQEKLKYEQNEIDLLIQHHEFIAEYPGKKKEIITSTMVEKGIRGGDSAMARTVSLPLAIATKLILQGKIGLTGVHIPVHPEIYRPILSELETLNIKLVDRSTEIN